ncbi:hypothetical protein CBR_g4034 [Chara braunii]|uniref:RNA-directed DNA polymerase n=1 Tax=Chara braunii TaxID=69332 RepID=A0A388KH47_CHABU|nr:hypothetical protein CBR_g4034 [Chara braunii]|eukprot:GBG69338.1 hypothetical protein CBR_g4034 [Chara braunii]
MRGRPLTPQARLAQAARTRNQAKTSASQEPLRRELESGRRKEVVEVEDDDDEEEEDEKLCREEDQRAEQRARKKGTRGEAEPVIYDGPPKKKKYAVRLEEGFDVERVIDRLLEGHNDLMTLKEILASAPRLYDELKGRLSRRLIPNVHLGTILPKEAEWVESGTKVDWKCVACGTVDLVVKGSKCAAMVDIGAEMNIIREADAIKFGLDIDRSDCGILHGASCKAVFCGTASNVLIEVGKVKARACFFIMPDVDHGILLGRNTGPRSVRNRPNPGSFTIEESEGERRRLRAEPEAGERVKAFSLSLSNVGKAMDLVAAHEMADSDAIQALREQVLKCPEVGRLELVYRLPGSGGHPASTQTQSVSRPKQGSQRRYKTVDKKCRPVPVLVTEDEEAYYERERGLIRRMRESVLAGPCRINEENKGELIIGELDFLLPQERTLMVELMKRRHRAYTFSDEERGRLDVDKIHMIHIHTVPHEPWNMRGARYPNPDEEKKVVDYLDGKIHTHVADYSNLYSGYDQFPVSPPDRPVTAMHTPRGLIHMNVAPQGWTNAVAMVQRAMIRVMQSVSPHITQPYIDDLAVKELAVKETDEVSPGVRRFVWEHIQDLEKVLSLLEEHNLTASGAKSRYCMREATILRFICSEKGQRPDVKKTDKITEWPVLFHSITNVRSFLEVLIQADMEGKERPLRFESRTLCTTERDYSQFKRETLAVLHCLRIFQNYIFGRRFILRVDPTALAYSLKNYVPSDPTVARWLTYIWMFNFELGRIPGSKNRADGLSRINWDKQEGEAVENTPPVDGFLDQEEDVRLHINKWSPRVPSCVGYPIWQTPSGYERRDELVLKPFEEEDPWGGKDVQWMMELALTSSHSLVEDMRTIEEGPGQVERHEDLMGGIYLLVNTLLQESLDQSDSLNPTGNVDEVRESQDDEFEEGEIKEAFRAEEYDGIYLEMGLLLSCEMRLRDAGDRAQRMLQRYLVRDDHLFERSRLRQGEPLHPRLEREVGAVVHLDLLFMPLGDQGYNYIFDARDNLSGFVDGHAIRTKTRSALVSCIEEYYLRYPFVREFVMDRGSEFTCQEVQELLSRYGVAANYTTAAHPQANAPVERGHSTITSLLAKWTEGRPNQWPRYLRAAFFVENITVKRSTKYAPATLWYGRHATFPIESFLKTWRRQDLEVNLSFEELFDIRARQVGAIEERIQEASDQVARSRMDDKDRWDQSARVRKVPLAVGDVVLLYYSSLEKQWSMKLDKRWLGPYRIVRVGDFGAYQIEELNGTEWKDWVFGTRLKKFVAREEPEKEMEAEIPKRVDLRTRERAPVGETVEEKRARRTRRIDEIWQERQRLEAAGELPEQQQGRQRLEAAGELPEQQQERQRSEAAGALPGQPPSAPARAPEIPEMWRDFWERRGEELPSPVRAGFGVARKAEERLDRKIKFLAKTTFDRHLLLESDLAGKKMKETNHGVHLEAMEVEIQELRALVVSQAAIIESLRQQTQGKVDKPESSRQGEQRQPGRGLPGQPSASELRQEPPMGRVIL